MAQPFMKTPWHGAQTTLFCLLDDSIGKWLKIWYTQGVIEFEKLSFSNIARIYNLTTTLMQQKYRNLDYITMDFLAEITNL